jgi:beta-N-acetylhexosaminidase
MAAAAGKRIPFIVLDRPNPLGGEAMEGPPLKPEFRSFVGAFPIPVRYGLTPGELAGFIKDTQKLDLDLSIVKLKHWGRSQWYDETGLVCVPPSPNVPTLGAALAYPGTCLVEGTNLSEGRGTTKPFELVGAPWIDGSKLAESLNRANLPGVLFRATTFTPTFSKFSGEACHGIQLHIVDRKTFRPIVTAVAILKEIRSAYANKFQFREKHFDRLAGSNELRKAVEQNLAVENIAAAWNASLRKFEALRTKYLLYP